MVRRSVLTMVLCGVAGCANSVNGVIAGHAMHPDDAEFSAVQSNVSSNYRLYVLLAEGVPACDFIAGKELPPAMLALHATVPTMPVPLGEYELEATELSFGSDTWSQLVLLPNAPKLRVERSSATGLAGSFEFELWVDGERRPVSGHFDAAPCGT